MGWWWAIDTFVNKALREGHGLSPGGKGGLGMFQFCLFDTFAKKGLREKSWTFSRGKGGVGRGCEVVLEMLHFAPSPSRHKEDAWFASTMQRGWGLCQSFTVDEKKKRLPKVNCHVCCCYADG